MLGVVGVTGVVIKTVLAVQLIKPTSVLNTISLLKMSSSNWVYVYGSVPVQR